MLPLFAAVAEGVFFSQASEMMLSQKPGGSADSGGWIRQDYVLMNSIRTIFLIDIIHLTL
jgi:hypothetical protein